MRAEAVFCLPVGRSDRGGLAMAVDVVVEVPAYVAGRGAAVALVAAVLR